MSVVAHLSTYGVSFEDARQFIFDNLSDPQLIFNTANQYDVTPIMLAELYGGVSSDDVYGFFTSQGMDASILERDETGNKGGFDLVIDDTEDKINISAVDYSSFTNSADAVLTSLGDFRSDSRFQDVDGTGQTVVIIDTAFDLNHEYFGSDANGDGISDRIIYAQDYTDEGDGANTDNPEETHGTHVASIIGSSNPSVPGVAPGVSMITLQVLGAQGGTGQWTQQALQWVIDNASEYNIAAVNLSLGDSSNSDTSQTSWASDEFQALNALGIAVVVAAGNDYEFYKTAGVGYPASDPSALTVSAVHGGANGTPDQLTSFSQRSQSLTDILAPGFMVSAAEAGGGSVALSGTSMAAPFVSGAIALAQQVAESNLGRRLSIDELQSLLAQSSDIVIDREVADGVPNSGLAFPRINVLSLAESILLLDGDTPPNDGQETPTTGDTGNTAETAGSLTVGALVEDTLETVGDSDWFAVSVSAGASYVISLEGDTLSDPYLRLYDQAGNQIAYNDDANGRLDSEIRTTSPVDGTFYLSAGSYLGQGTGTYTLRMDAEALNEAPEADLNSGAISGAIDFVADTDAYSVFLEAGQTYQIDMRGEASGGGTLADPFLTLRNTSSQVAVISDDDSGTGLDARLEYSPDSSGFYDVVTSAFGQSTGSYQLTLQSLGPLDVIAGDSSTAQSLASGSPISSAVDFASDADWFRVELNTGISVRFDLTGSQSGDGTLDDPLLQLYSGSGQLLATDDDGGDGLESSLTWLPTSTGTYYVSAQAFGSDTGSYQIEMFNASRDIPSNTATSGALSVGQEASGDIEIPNDEDWYAISLSAGIEYRFELTGSGSGTGTLSDPLLRLYGSNGTLITSNDDGGNGLDSMLDYTPSGSSTFYLAAGAYGAAVGSYQLSAAVLESSADEDDVEGNTGTSATLSLSSETSGAIDFNADEDWYSVVLTAGGSYQFYLAGSVSGPGTLSDPLLTLYDASGAYVAQNDDGGFGMESQLEFSPSSSGIYYIAARGFGSNTGSYQLAFTGEDGSITDIAGDTSTTATLTTGEQLSGIIDASGDEDWYVVQLSSGSEYEFSLTGALSGTGDLTDPYLRLYNSTGELITVDDDSGSGLESLLNYISSTSGTYFISAGGYGSYVGSYQLSLVDLSGSDIPDSVTTTATLSVGSSVDGLVDIAGDEDWYAIALEEGGVYEFALTGSQSGTGDLNDPVLGIYDGSGEFITSDDDSGSGLESLLTFNATSTDTYYIAARSYGSNTGTYQLSANSIGAADVAGGTGTNFSLTSAESVSGSVDFSGDQDWYAVSLNAGQTLEASLTGAQSGNGTLSDPLLQLYDGAGNLTATDDDSGTGLESLLIHTVGTSDVYYLSAAGFSSSTGTYQIDLQII